MAHDGPAKALVAALKFHAALPAAEVMAAQIAAGAPEWLLAEERCSSRARRTRAAAAARGFDQAERLRGGAQPALGACGRPVPAPLGRATRQLGAGRAERLRAGRIAVEVRGAVPLRAVLVDDVHTTGATLDACARALRQAGSQQVLAVTYGRALGR